MYPKMSTPHSSFPKYLMQRDKMTQQSPQAARGGVPMGAALAGCGTAQQEQRGSAGVRKSSAHPMLPLVL